MILVGIAIPLRRSSSGSLGSKRALELLAPSPTCLPMRACALHDYIVPGPGSSDLRASRHLRPGRLCTSEREPASCVRPRHTLRAPFSPFSRRHRRVLTPHHVSRPARRAIVSLPCHHYGPAGTPWRACRVPRVACSFPHLSFGKYHDSLSLLAWPQTLHVSDGWSRSVWSRSLVVGDLAMCVMRGDTPRTRPCAPTLAVVYLRTVPSGLSPTGHCRTTARKSPNSVQSLS